MWTVVGSMKAAGEAKGRWETVRAGGREGVRKMPAETKQRQTTTHYGNIDNPVASQARRED